MLSDIEKFILGGNDAHDLVSLAKSKGSWKISVSPCFDSKIIKNFIFSELEEKYEQDLTEEGEEIEYPLPIIGIDAKHLANGKWQFCINAAEVEWGFISNWPKNA